MDIKQKDTVWFIENGVLPVTVRIGWVKKQFSPTSYVIVSRLREHRVNENMIFSDKESATVALIKIIDTRIESIKKTISSKKFEIKKLEDIKTHFENTKHNLKP